MHPLIKFHDFWEMDDQKVSLAYEKLREKVDRRKNPDNEQLNFFCVFLKKITFSLGHSTQFWILSI